MPGGVGGPRHRATRVDRDRPVNRTERRTPSGDGAGSTATEESSYKAGHASSALGWSFLNTVTSKLGTIAVGIVLARLLGPAEFGTYAVAYIALLAILSFNELGVSLAIVRWPTDPKDIAPTVTAIALLSSLMLAGAVYLVAPTFATAMGDAGATDLVRWLSVCVVLDGAVAVPAALLQRYFRQDRRMIADQTSTWLGAALSLALAFTGAGAASLVVGRIVGSVAAGCLYVAFSPLPYRVRLDRRHLRPLLAFGLPLAGASMIVFAVGFVDQVTVGAVLGPTVLGYYVLAYNLATWPVTLLSLPTRSVAPALFARIQGDRSLMRQRFNQLLRPLASVALPFCVLLSAASEEIVTFVYGSDWTPAATALQWLAITAAMRIVFELAYDFLVVLRRSGSILVIQLIWLIVLLPALLLGVHAGGLAGVSLAQTVVAAGVVLPLYSWQLARVGVPLRELVRSVGFPVLVGAVLYLGVRLARLGDLGDFATLVVSGLLALAALAPLLFLTRQDVRSWTARSGAPA